MMERGRQELEHLYCPLGVSSVQFELGKAGLIRRQRKSGRLGTGDDVQESSSTSTH